MGIVKLLLRVSKDARIFLVSSSLILLVSSCSNGTIAGELVGVLGRKAWGDTPPYGMVYVPSGAFIYGGNEDEVTWSISSAPKTVSVDAFWMDETEITNNEYRQFVYYVKDSIFRTALMSASPEAYGILDDGNGTPREKPLINWKAKLDFKSTEVIEASKEMCFDTEESINGGAELNTYKLLYKYSWIDLKQAAIKSNRYDPKTGSFSGTVTDIDGNTKAIKNRSSFILRDNVLVYPDTLVWMSDYSNSYNEPFAKNYFAHPSYDNYPVVGVNWKQAEAFSAWRTDLLKTELAKRGIPPPHAYRLPTEVEWEYASRGGLHMAKYPWGGPYIRTAKGCFLANFKPLRGDYASDGGIRTMQVASFEPNDYGLYDMAGNVAEWTKSAFDESVTSFTHDMNPDYQYNARDNDPPIMKRKVVRGGSWKDISFYLQNASRGFEYQDSVKSFIGFRCIRDYSGEAK